MLDIVNTKWSRQTQIDGWTDGRMDRWTDGQMDGQSIIINTPSGGGGGGGYAFEGLWIYAEDAYYGFSLSYTYNETKQR